MPHMTLGRAAAIVALALSALALSLDVSTARPKDISGNYNCYCDGGNQGTCSTVQGNSNAKCEKGTSDTCAGTCKIVTFSKYATDGAIMHAGGPASPGNAR